jgi:hypothetical protein
VGRYDGIACKYEGCSKQARCRGYCMLHYNRLVRAGVISIRSDIDRFQAKTVVGATCYQGTNCVIWTGAKALGYGSFRAGGHAGPAHRWIYTQRIGPVPAGMQVDHLCHNADLSCAGGKDCPHRAYVNVLHLEAVSPLVNSQRGRKSDPWTHCKYGHPMTPDNLHTSFGTRRRCKTCANAASRAFRDRRRAMRNHDESPGG